MEAIFFSLKRAHHAGLSFGRAALAGTGLTPARFDLLYALTDLRPASTQAALRAVLGVTRSTISEMLKSLEELGFVRRERVARDKRMLRVLVTERGREVFLRAYRMCVGCGAATIAVDVALRAFDDDAARFALEAACRDLRAAFGDRAVPNLYEWEAFEPEEVSELYLVDFVRCRPDAIRSWFRESARCS